MNRDQVAALVRVAAEIADDPNILVLGSQSILGSYPEFELPDEAIASREADVAFLDDPDWAKGDQVDVLIGELSPYDLEHRVYAQGVEVSTATLPLGWRDRLVAFEHPDAGMLALSASTRTTWLSRNWSRVVRRISCSPMR